MNKLEKNVMIEEFETIAGELLLLSDSLTVIGNGLKYADCRTDVDIAAAAASSLSVFSEMAASNGFRLIEILAELKALKA